MLSCYVTGIKTTACVFQTKKSFVSLRSALFPKWLCGWFVFLFYWSDRMKSRSFVRSRRRCQFLSCLLSFFSWVEGDRLVVSRLESVLSVPSCLAASLGGSNTRYSVLRVEKQIGSTVCKYSEDLGLALWFSDRSKCG